MSFQTRKTFIFIFGAQIKIFFEEIRELSDSP